MSPAGARTRATFPVAVFGLLVRDGHLLLLRRRATGYRDGWLSLPAGHLEVGEDVETAVRREVAEETGVDLRAARTELVLTAHRAPEHDHDLSYLDLYFTVEGWEGEPVVAEPEKCSGLVLAPVDDLPGDVVEPVAEAVRAWRCGRRSSWWGWPQR